jgi:hypothetical protein
MKSLPVAALLLAFPVALSAQTMSSYSESGETIILPNLPFHAERVTHLERRLADSTLQSREVHETIDRDSEGRVLIESKVINSGGSLNSKPNVFHELLDPVERVSTTWSTLSNTATTQTFSKNAHVRITPLPLSREENINPPKGDSAYEVTTEDLGKRMIAGLAATGTHTTTTIPAARYATAKPLTVSREIWTSADLQMTLLEIDKSPITGSTTSEIISLSRNEPSASLFHVPEGLTKKSFPGGGVNFGATGNATPPTPKPTLPQP